MIPTSAVQAGSNAGGALILHTDDAYTYSQGTACTTAYAVPSSCEAAITRTDKSEGSVVWVLASFDSTASPAVTVVYFGIDYDDENLDPGSAYRFCGPTGTLEVPDADWPYTGRGNSVAFGEAVTGQLLFPFYVFRIDGGVEGSYFSTAVNPSAGYAAFVDDSDPPELDEVTRFGTVRWFAAGENACSEGGGDDDMDQVDGGDSEDSIDIPEGGGDSAVDLHEGWTFVELDSPSDSAFVADARALASEYGIRILVEMIPDGLICVASDEQRAALAEDTRVSIVDDGEIPGVPSAVSDGDALRPGDGGYAARVWNALVTQAPPDTAEQQQEEVFFDDTGPEVGDDELTPPVQKRQNAAYMLGEIGVSLLYMDSDSTGDCDDPGHPEDWTTEEADSAYVEVVAGFTNLASLARDGYVVFQIWETHMLSTTVEPVHLNHEDGTWVNEALDQLGFTEGDYADKEYALCNSRRAQHGTDWWFITFLIDDSCDHYGPGNTHYRFANGQSSWAPTYGWAPRITLLTINPGDPPLYMELLDHVTMHETCHVFGAADEYRDDGCSGLNGYLHALNGNSTGDSLCAEEQLPCVMDNARLYPVLCPFTMAHIGWRDSQYVLDSAADHVYDPIDHPDSRVTMLVGEGDTLEIGDWVDIRKPNGSWTKRLFASYWNLDRGRMLWDGIDYSGHVSPPDTSYTWTRNAGAPDQGSPHDGTLAEDTQAPVILDLMIAQDTDEGPSHSSPKDTLSFRFADSDTRSGRVRAMAFPEAAGTDSSVILFDEFRADTSVFSESIVQTYTRPHAGHWTLRLQVWDVGAGHQAMRDSTYLPVTGVADGRIYVPEVALSPSRPNPSRAWIAWDLELQHAKDVSLRVVGIDGRTVRAWTDRSLPGGRTRILWDGLDSRGHRVTNGRYYLVVTDQSGKRISKSATVVR